MAEMSDSLSATSAKQETVFNIFDVSWKTQRQVDKKLLGQCYSDKLYPMTVLFTSAKGEESAGMKAMPKCHFLIMSTPVVI